MRPHSSQMFPLTAIIVFIGDLRIHIVLSIIVSINQELQCGSIYSQEE